MTLDFDSYGEVINTENTYKAIANELVNGDSVLIGWTDQEGTHVDILFCFDVNKAPINTVQGGISANDLFISIMRRGAFAFDISMESHHGYYAEKLNLEGWGSTVEKLAELFNAVRKEIYNA